MAEDTLASRRCQPCSGEEPPLSDEEARRLQAQVPQWGLDDGALVRELTFKDFQGAMRFIGRLAELAEAEGHHPDFTLHGYKHVRVRLTTHAVGGLSENDFILAAKAELLL